MSTPVFNHTLPLGAIAATMLRIELRGEVFCVGEMGATGTLLAVGGLSQKLEQAAVVVRQNNWGHGHVIIPLANTKGRRPVDSNGKDVEVPREVKEVLTILPTATDLDALRILFNRANRTSAFG